VEKAESGDGVEREWRGGEERRGSRGMWVGQEQGGGRSKGLTWD
jgi:hypothetical protein